MEGVVSPNPESMKSIEAITSFEQLEDAPFGVMAILASAAAWAPNPEKPPFYLDLPYENGEVRQDIASKFAANRTLYTIEQYIPNLKKLKAIAMDAGLQDEGISNSTRKLHELLDVYDIPHMYESYQGNHTTVSGNASRPKPFLSFRNICLLNSAIYLLQQP